MRHDIELHDVFAMYIPRPGPAQNIHQSGLIDLPGDNLRGQGNLGKQARKFTGCLRELALLLHDVTIDGHADVTHNFILYIWGIATLCCLALFLCRLFSFYFIFKVSQSRLFFEPFSY